MQCGATGEVDIEAAEVIEAKLRAKKSMWSTKRWRKWRDARLAEVVIVNLPRRAEFGMVDVADVEAPIERIRRRSKEIRPERHAL